MGARNSSRLTQGHRKQVEAQKRKVLDRLLTLEGYWSGADECMFECARAVCECLPSWNVIRGNLSGGRVAWDGVGERGASPLHLGLISVRS